MSMQATVWEICFGRQRWLVESEKDSLMNWSLGSRVQLHLVSYKKEKATPFFRHVEGGRGRDVGRVIDSSRGMEVP